MIKYCKISKCKYPMSHTSMGHLCGSCRKFGHGVIECNKSFALYFILNNYLNDRIPDNIICSFGGCQTRHNHTTDSHHCLHCFERYHSINTCPNSDLNICCPICRTNNIILHTQQKIKGLTNECVICMDTNIEIFFPKCGHVCICYKCALQLNTNTNTNTNTQLEPIRNESTLYDELYNIDLIKSYLVDYPSYLIINEGLGSYSIIRRLNIKSNLEGLFINLNHNYTIERIRQKEEFIQGYCNVNNNLYKND